MTIELAHGRYAATVEPHGAVLATLTLDGRDLVVPSDGGEPPLYRGAVLAPWPNRVRDGRYTAGGVVRQLPITEPERHNALHGLLVGADFEVVAATSSTATFRRAYGPTTGYPFALETEVAYALSDHGLDWTIRTTNVGSGEAPYGASAHPYVVAGPGPVDDWTLEVPASRVLEVDAERLLPRAVVPVEGGGFDFRAPRRVADTFLDHAFTGLGDAADVELRLSAGEHGVSVRWDPRRLPWLQLHTADADARRGLAAEPMTCPPDAFNSGTDLVLLAPGDRHEASFGISGW